MTDGSLDEDFPCPDPKRPRLSDEGVELTNAKLALPAIESLSPSTPSVRKPLTIIRNPPSPEDTKNESMREAADVKYFSVLWRKRTAKKNKTWDGDGTLLLKAGYAIMYDDKGGQMGRLPWQKTLTEGTALSIGGKEVETESEINKADFDARRPNIAANTSQDVKPTATFSVNQSVKPAASNSGPGIVPVLQKMPVMPHIKTMGKAPQKFKNPMKDTTGLAQVPQEAPTPRHDPLAPGALVFKRPASIPRSFRLVDVVLDPLLGKHLRPHQLEGVQFLYECVMGLRGSHGEGCILADEMGLGKTLQSIALLWTLMKQNPIYGTEPVVKKALIVCPVTLTKNWKKEFAKWLPGNRIGVFDATESKLPLSWFTSGSTYQVIIAGYERLRTITDELRNGTAIDIVIIDEGHRLKTEKNKSAQAILSLNIPRRIVLSGTPIQNDLSEFFVMANFVNDGCLGTYKSFVKNFETPILKSRQPNALEKDIEKGGDRGEELTRTTAPFILRRTADILSRYLPAKTEYVLFCTPTPEQADIYRLVIGSPLFQTGLGTGENALQLINILKHVCNSPSLLTQKSGEDNAAATSLAELVAAFPPAARRHLRNQASIKIRMLDQLLHQIRSTTDEKVVIVSHRTSTLDIIANLLSSTGLPFERLDGDTHPSKRMPLVDKFNKSKPIHCFAFLLSAKAGGLGLNLIGASRLILFDVDWNPAIEEQAMARIHRQGQKRDCKIYRFVVKDAIEEKIWMRQIEKKGLAETFAGGGSGGGDAGLTGGKAKKGGAAFSKEELKDLFSFDQKPRLKLHESVGCPCAQVSSIDKDFSHRSSPTEGDAEISDLVSEPSPDLTSLTCAANLSTAVMDDQEHKIASGLHPKQAGQTKRQKELRTLMEYAHFDTAQLITKLKPLSQTLEDDDEAPMRVYDIDDVLNDDLDPLDDECLTTVLQEQNEVLGGSGGISWIFKKSSGAKKVDDDVKGEDEDV